MKILQKLPLFVVVWGISAILRAASADESPAIGSGSTLLMLRNGQILEGRIVKLRDQYLVDQPDGEIRIRAADVDFFCGNLEEGYQHKRAVIQAGNWQDHLELARWCHKNRLPDHAADELAAAEAAAPHNPLIGLLRRQMEPEPQPAAKSEKTLPPEDAVSNEELDRMVRSLPPRTMESFTQTVQPMLMNNCTAAGCHGPQSTNNFRLFRVSAGQAANRRLTQRNLYTVLQYVNGENPEQSPLLTVPAAPHGTAKNAIFAERHALQYSRLALWIAGLSAGDSSPSQALVNRTSPQTPALEASEDSPTAPRLLPQDMRKAKPLASAQRSPERPMPETAAATKDITPASYEEPPAEFLQPNRSRAGKANIPPANAQRFSSPKVKRGAPIPQATSKDPFDPDVFNRRFHQATPPSEGANQSSAAKPADSTPANGQR